MTQLATIKGEVRRYNPHSGLHVKFQMPFYAVSYSGRLILAHWPDAKLAVGNTVWLVYHTEPDATYRIPVTYFEMKDWMGTALDYILFSEMMPAKVIEHARTGKLTYIELWDDGG